MRRYFVDAFYWIALFSHRDQWHRLVLAFDETLGDAPLYTTDEVLITNGVSLLHTIYPY